MDIRQLLYRTLFAAMLCVAAVSTVYAEDVTLTFDQLLQEALQKSALVREVESSIAAEQADGIALKTLPNPELFGEGRPYLNDADGRDVEYEVGVSQALRLSHFGARSRVAQLIDRTTDVERKLKLKEFEQGLLLTFGKAWALQEKTRLTNEAYERARKLSKMVAASSGHGLVPESTQLLFAAESKKLAAEQRALEGDCRRAIAELSRRASSPVGERRLSSPSFPALPSQMELQANGALPLVERVKLRSELGREQVRLARLDAYPKFAPRLAFEHTSDGDDRVNIGVSIDLPFSDRNEAEQVRNTAARRAADAELQYLQSGGLKEELALLLSGARASSDQAEAFRREILPALSDALNAAEREFQAGQGNPFQVWQTLQELSSAQDRYLELWTKALSERVELSILLGQNL